MFFCVNPPVIYMLQTHFNYSAKFSTCDKIVPLKSSQYSNVDYIICPKNKKLIIQGL